MRKVDVFLSYTYVWGFKLLNKQRALLDPHAGLLEPGVPVSWHPQILTDKLTLSQPGDGGG